MPIFRNLASGAWALNVATLRFLARVAVGLVGATWLLGGVIGIIVSAVQLAFLSLAGAGLLAFVGWALAYGAFHHWPWEPFPLPDRQPTER